MNINLKETVDLLKKNDKFLIILHQSPDGDTTGSGFALYYSLIQLGKRVMLKCSDPFSKKYDYLYNDYNHCEFDPDFIVSVDIADKQLIGDSLKQYRDNIDLAIDHHQSNTFYAKKTFLNSSASANCEIMFDLLSMLGVNLNKNIVNGLYTGITTDTGCFKFSNTSANTHIVAAKLIQLGADYIYINKIMFDTKSKSRIMIEQRVLNNIKFFNNDRIAVIYITRKMLENCSLEDGELDGLATLPKQIEGVDVGITLKEREDGAFKISVRTSEKTNASDICKNFNGGGHSRAGGCLINKDLDEAIEMLVEVSKKAIGE